MVIYRGRIAGNTLRRTAVRGGHHERGGRPESRAVRGALISRNDSGAWQQRRGRFQLRCNRAPRRSEGLAFLVLLVVDCRFSLPSVRTAKLFRYQHDFGERYDTRARRNRRDHRDPRRRARFSPGAVISLVNVVLVTILARVASM